MWESVANIICAVRDSIDSSLLFLYLTGVFIHVYLRISYEIFLLIVWLLIVELFLITHLLKILLGL